MSNNKIKESFVGLARVWVLHQHQYSFDHSVRTSARNQRRTQSELSWFSGRVSTKPGTAS